MFEYILFLSEDGRETHDDGGKCRFHVLVRIVDQLLDARHQMFEDDVLLTVSRKGGAEIWKSRWVMSVSLR